MMAYAQTVPDRILLTFEKSSPIFPQVYRLPSYIYWFSTIEVLCFYSSWREPSSSPLGELDGEQNARVLPEKRSFQFAYKHKVLSRRIPCTQTDRYDITIIKQRDGSACMETLIGESPPCLLWTSVSPTTKTGKLFPWTRTVLLHKKSIERLCVCVCFHYRKQSLMS